MKKQNWYDWNTESNEEAGTDKIDVEVLLDRELLKTITK